MTMASGSSEREAAGLLEQLTAQLSSLPDATPAIYDEQLRKLVLTGEVTVMWPDDADIHVTALIGVAATEAETLTNNTNAALLLERAITVTPGQVNSGHYNNLGCAQAYRHEWAKALEAFEGAQERNVPDHCAAKAAAKKNAALVRKVRS